MNDSTVKDLDELHRKAKSGRMILEPEWFMCLAYFQNRQWLAWGPSGLYQPQLRPNRITIQDNRISPAIRVEVAKLTKNRPVFTVSPRTADEQDAHASEMGEQLMRYLWKHLHLQEADVKALLWSRICGAGFLKAFWDPTLGDGTDAVVGPDGQVLTDAKGAPMRGDQIDPEQLSRSLGAQVSVKKINQGDIRVEVRSPFQIFPDPLADSFSECEWLIEESVKSVESIQKRYGVTVPADSQANPGLIEARLLGTMPTGTGTYRGARVREYWCKPNLQHPNGRRAVWVKDQVLEENDNPFDAFPYVMFTGIQIPGRFWPTSVANELRGPQTELNKVKSQIAENRNRVGNPTIMANVNAIMGSKEDFAASLTMPGGIAWWQDIGSPNQPYQYLPAPPLPQYVIDEIQRIEESIQEISGQHEVSSASVPPGVTAASAINLLLEADDTRLGPAVTDHETQLAALGQKILKLAAKYYTDARTIRIAGDNGQYEIFDFRGAMLRDNTHVEVQAGSAFPQSKAAKQAAMQDLLTFFVQSGNAPHGKQLAQFLKDWEIGGADRLISEYTKDDAQIASENMKIQQGIPIPINDYDNDEAHVDGHQDEQKENHYQFWPPNSRQIMEAHVAAHKQRLAQQQQAQMQLEMQQQGQPPPGVQAAQAGQQLQAGAQQQQIQAAQAQHQVASQGAQQGQQMALDTAQAAQQQRHADETHQQAMAHAQQMHEAKLKQMAQSRPQPGGQRR